MKVIILTEGGQDIGFGHVTRCLSLYQAFEARRYEPEFIIAGDDSVKDILPDKKFRILNWRHQREELMRALQETEVVLVDSYLAGFDVYKMISEAVRIPVFIDDNKRLAYPRGIVVNWGIHAHDMQYPQDPQVTYLLGPGYIALRKAFSDVDEKKINPEVSQVMVTFGGEDSKNMTPKVLEFLRKKYPKLKKHVIIGRAFTNTSEIEAAADINTYLVHSPDDEGMKTIMLKSDIAISAGGQTLYELARVGVPTVGVIVAENQRNSVNAWAKTGFLENAGFWTDEDIMAKIETKFQGILGLDKRARAAASGRCRVSGNGAEKIIDFIASSETFREIHV